MRDRSWKGRVGEFLIWAAIAIATAVVLVVLSERFLPPNY